eukprot:3045535-Rhodomonas_salina.2
MGPARTRPPLREASALAPLPALRCTTRMCARSVSQLTSLALARSLSTSPLDRAPLSVTHSLSPRTPPALPQTASDCLKLSQDSRKHMPSTARGRNTSDARQMRSKRGRRRTEVLGLFPGVVGVVGVKETLGAEGWRERRRLHEAFPHARHAVPA